MTERRDCPECGASLPPEAPAGACPRCLLAVGLEAGEGSEGGKGAEARPPAAARRGAPGIEEIQPHFPTLELLEPIGHGGMGVVYKARQRALDRPVALKVLWPELGADPAFAERFTREARALARLDHPNIVHVYESGETGGWYYLVMEFVEGTNLRSVLDAGACHPREALAIVPQICDALQYAHDKGVVHRDIKPANVLVQSDGRVKIADFGLAKLVAGEEPDHEHTLTREGQVMGTLHYMAPEQYATPNDVDHRADIYSLGVVFYEMLTGEVPIGRFQAPSHKVEIDVRLDDVVLRALERERDRRYQRASEVKTEVSHITSTEHQARVPPPVPVAEPATSAGSPASVEEPRRCGIGFAAFLLVLLCAVGLVLAAIPLDSAVPFMVATGAGMAAMVVGLVSLFRIALSNGALTGFPYAFTGLVAPPFLACCGLFLIPVMLRHHYADHPPIYVGEDGVEIGDIRIDENGVDVGPVSIREDGVRIPGSESFRQERPATTAQFREIVRAWTRLRSTLRDRRLGPTEARFFVADQDLDRLRALALPENRGEFDALVRELRLGVLFLEAAAGDVPVADHAVSRAMVTGARRAVVTVEGGAAEPGSRIVFDMVRDPGGWRFRLTPVEYEPARDE